jgi:hypothetical protein
MRISSLFLFPYELSSARINGKHVLKIVSSEKKGELTFLMTHDNFSLSHTTNEIEDVTTIHFQLIFLSCINPFAGWLGALSTAVALFISPLTIGVCKRKSTRLTAVIGGLVT